MSKWEVTKLNEILTPAKIVKCGKKKYTVLSMTMHDGIVLQSDRFKKSLASSDTSEYKVVSRGQLVVGFPIDEGVLYIQQYDFDGIMSPAYDVWNVDYSKVSVKYFEYALHSPQSMQYYASKLRGTTARRRSITKGDLLSLSFPLPPLETQHKIAATLDKVTHTIDLCNAILEKLDLLVKSRFVEMFGDPNTNSMGWECCELGDCLESIDNGKSYVCDNYCRTGDNPAILKLSAVTYGVYNPDENKAMIDEDLFDESSEVKDSDLLFTRKNTPDLVGMSAYVFSTPPKLMMPDLIFRLNVKSTCNKKYLWKLINHDLFRPLIQNIANGSAKSMSNISKERLSKLTIPVPPLTLQKQFADFVTQIDKSKYCLVGEQILGKAEMLIKILKQEYFG